MDENIMPAGTGAPAPKPRKKRSPSMPTQPLPYRRRPTSMWPAVSIVIIIVLVALVAYFAYYYFSNNSFNLFGASSDQTPSASSSTSAEDYQVPLGVTIPSTADNSAAANSTDPAANWLSFSWPTLMATSSSSANPALSFSFKYPGGLSLTTTTASVTLSDASTSTPTRVIVSWTKSALDFAAYLKALDQANAKAWEGKPSVAVITSTAPVLIAGYPAIIRQQKLLAADLNEYVAYIKASTTVYSVGLIAPQLNQNLGAFLSVFLNNFKIGR